MKINDVFVGEVTDLSHKGLGVVTHPEGMKFFVPGAWMGDRGEFLITELEKKYGFAQIYKLTTPSTDRVEAPCPHLGYEAGKCGGCPWMVVKYTAQLKAKHILMLRQFERAKIDLSHANVQYIQGAQKNYGYRSRAQFKTDGVKLGYVSPESKTLAPITDCVVLSEHNRSLLKKALEQLPRPDWRPKGKFIFNFLEVDDELDAGEALINQRRPFRQAHEEQNLFLKNLLRKFLVGADKKKHVLELFCGSGNFIKIIAENNFAGIHALEWDGTSVQLLSAQKIPNVSAYKADLFSLKSIKMLNFDKSMIEIIVLDPPREGFATLDQWVREFKNLKKIIYISCDSQSYVADIKPLVAANWRVTFAQPVDMFPHTPHFELFSVLERSE